MENSNQASPQVPSGLPKPAPMSSHIKAKHTAIPVLIMVGILLALVLGALMMQTVRDGKFALSPKKANMASVGLLAQSNTPPASSGAGTTGSLKVGDRYNTYDGFHRDPSGRSETFYLVRDNVIIGAGTRDAMQQQAIANSRDSSQPPIMTGEGFLPPPAVTAPAAAGVNTAGANCTGNRCQFDNPLGQSGTLEVFLNKLLDVIILIGSIVVVLSIIMAGLKYVTAQGDEGKISDAHKQLTWTVIGAAILLGAKVIAMVVQNTVRALS